MDNYVEFACPKCGSDDLHQWSNVPTRYEIERISRKDDGTLSVDFTGNSEPFYDDARPTGYSCGDYCYEGPLEDFIVNKEA